MPDIRDSIRSALAAFANSPLRQSAIGLLSVLGYRSDRTVDLGGSDPQAFLDFVGTSAAGVGFNETKANCGDWISADLLFQLTDQELSGQNSLFNETDVTPSLLQSYLFFAIELKGDTYARGELADIARQMNRLFPMPVMVFLKHKLKTSTVLSIAVINRLQHERGASKDALAKVTIVRDISLAEPHPGHLDILTSLALQNLVHPQRLPIRSFDALHAAWEEVFNGERLNRSFYRELSNWYFWALPQVEFPDDTEPDDKKRRATALIRLLTRLIFCWFLREKDLIPHRLFQESELAGILSDLNPESSSFYQEILQNQFSATLSQTMGETDVDGPSSAETLQPCVPNYLFFSETRSGVDLSGPDAYGAPSRRKENVRGLLRILGSYKFTIVENTPIEQELALDPELLGKVFENLLASYNEETKATARKHTGSFYTPRPIVQYMVDEALKVYLIAALTHLGMSQDKAASGLDVLVAYTEQDHPFTRVQVDALLRAIHTCKFLDPACGSGAFPIGILQKLVHVISKLDPENTRWKQLQIDKANEIPDRTSRAVAIAAIERDFTENAADYGRKRYLIKNCLFGVDIQPVAIQISKLRLLISLVCVQRVNRRTGDSCDTHPLPNLKTNFVAANTLVGSKKGKQLELFADSSMKKLETNPQQYAPSFEPLWTFDRSSTDGFDIVIGNPPYFKENDDKERFNGLRDLECYQGKMDVWYLFVDVGLDLLKPGGVLSFIATNNWVTNAGASKIRNKIIRKSRLLSLVDFHDYMIFESASIQTMVMVLTKVDEPQVYTASISKANADFSKGDIVHLASGVRSDIAGLETFDVTIRRKSSLDRPLLFKSGKNAAILDCISAQADMHLAKQEIAQGIVPNPDRINSRNIKIFGKDVAERRGIAVGDGVFVLTDEQAAGIHPDERTYLKPLYEPVHIGKYKMRSSNLKILYTKRGSFDPHKSPSILEHLTRYKEVMEARRENRSGGIEYFNLHWPRDEALFLAGEKILAPRKCAEPTFFYTWDVAYVMLAVNVIQTTRLDMRYLSAVLNSSVIYFWLRHEGSMQGLNFQIDAGPLQRIPLVDIATAEQERIGTLLEVIQFTSRDAHPELDAAGAFLEEIMDACVMECYFREHMADRDLLFLDDLAPHLVAYDPKANQSEQREFVEDLYRTMNASDSPIPNRLLRICTDSPELLAVIKRVRLA